MSNIILNEKLCLDAQMSNIDEIIRRINKPKNAHLKKLSLMYFQNATISAISDALLHMKFNLRVLRVHEIDISSDEAHSIANFIAGGTLTKLTFSHTTIESPGSIAIFNSVAQSAIRKLIFYGTYIETSEACAIAQTLRNSSLVKLSLIDCTFEVGSSELIIGAVKNSAVKILKLVDIIIKDDAMTALIDCVENATLIKLFLRGARFKLARHSIKISMLVSAIQKSTLQCLNARNTILFEKAKDIIDVVEHSQLTKFYFDQWTFSSETIAEIMGAIRCNGAIKNISLANCTLTDQLLTETCNLLFIREPKGSLFRLADLEELCLSECNLNEMQFNAIINSIKRSSITSLDISGITHNDQTIVTICDLLENHDLRKINMNGISHAMLHSMLPSITQSKLIKVTHGLSSDTDGTLDEIKCFTKEQKNMLKNSLRVKSARHICCADANIKKLK